ncbi:MAG: sugar transferase [Victivallaceae bacterium]|nr:exopolysaccharide biosynthesis polyprenyl glycosylphosphotransferase [Victivallaceae bacterium]
MDPHKTFFDRDELIDLLLERAEHKRSARRKILMWKITVGAAYFVKRLFDIVVSIIILLMLTPLFVAVAAWIKLNSPGPLIYRQIRVGLNGRHFNFYKFRSMYQDADKRWKELQSTQNESKDGVIFKMKKDPRVTRSGRFIRKFSIDELPQLFNVLLGDMSLVGPRPPLPQEVDLYTLDDRKRLNVVPGITGLWQVSGRSDIPFKQQVELDKEYIKSQSVWKDIVIMLKTIPAVLTGKGAY